MEVANLNGEVRKGEGLLNTFFFFLLSSWIFPSPREYWILLSKEKILLPHWVDKQLGHMDRVQKIMQFLQTNGLTLRL